MLRRVLLHSTAFFAFTVGCAGVAVNGSSSISMKKLRQACAFQRVAARSGAVSLLTALPGGCIPVSQIFALVGCARLQAEKKQQGRVGYNARACACVMCIYASCATGHGALGWELRCLIPRHASFNCQVPLWGGTTGHRHAILWRGHAAARAGDIYACTFRPSNMHIQ